MPRLKIVLSLAMMLLLAAGVPAQQLTEPLGQPPSGAPPGAAPGVYGQRPSSSETTIEPGCVSRRSAVDATLEMLFFKLEGATDQTLVYNQNTGAELANVDDLNFNFEIGPRLTVGYQTSDGPTFEIGYFGVYTWRDGLLVTGDGNLTLPSHFSVDYDPILTPYGTVDYHDAHAMQINYSSRVNSVEANLAFSQEHTEVACLFGLRFIKLDEDFNLTSRRNHCGVSGYAVDTENDLFGGQIGMRWRRRGVRLDWLASLKLGVFHNRAKQWSLVTDRNSSVVLRSTGGRVSNASFLVDGTLAAAYCLRNGMHLIGGYNVVWIEGVARAPDQLDFTNNAASGTAVLFREGALMHGPHVALEARW